MCGTPMKSKYLTGVEMFSFSPQTSKKSLSFEESSEPCSSGQPTSREKAEEPKKEKKSFIPKKYKDLFLFEDKQQSTQSSSASKKSAKQKLTSDTRADTFAEEFDEEDANELISQSEKEDIQDEQEQSEEKESEESDDGEDVATAKRRKIYIPKSEDELSDDASRELEDLIRMDVIKRKKKVQIKKRRWSRPEVIVVKKWGMDHGPYAFKTLEHRIRNSKRLYSIFGEVHCLSKNLKQCWRRLTCENSPFVETYGIVPP